MDTKLIFSGREQLRILGRPTQMPLYTENKVLMCEYIVSPEVPSFNHRYVCETLEDMQQLYDVCAQGMAIRLDWYLYNELAKVQPLEEWLQEQERKPADGENDTNES